MKYILNEFILPAAVLITATAPFTAVMIYLLFN